MLKSSIDELKNITKADFCIADSSGRTVASTLDTLLIAPEIIAGFAASLADSQNVAGYNLLKIKDADNLGYVLVVNVGSNASGMDGHMLGRVACSEITHILAALREHLDQDGFYQSLLMDNLLPIDIYNKANKLNIRTEQSRIVFMVEMDYDFAESGKELLQNIFSENEADYITAVDEKNLILIKALCEEAEEDFESYARQIVSTLNTELMITGRVSYGTVAKELKEVTRSYKEAKIAMEVARIFYEDRTVADYSSLGIGRLIHQLPQNLCEMFITEIFGDNKILELEEEELTIIDKFFENNLNVSETARELVLHRNTLVYRLEKLQKYIGLDIRKFDDAMTFKIAMMVARYMKYLQQ